MLSSESTEPREAATLLPRSDFDVCDFATLRALCDLLRATVVVVVGVSLLLLLVVALRVF